VRAKGAISSCPAVNTISGSTTRAARSGRADCYRFSCAEVGRKEHHPHPRTTAPTRAPLPDGRGRTATATRAATPGRNHVNET
jgi:hypothetical protein